MVRHVVVLSALALVLTPIPSLSFPADVQHDAHAGTSYGGSPPAAHNEKTRSIAKVQQRNTNGGAVVAPATDQSKDGRRFNISETQRYDQDSGSVYRRMNTQSQAGVSQNPPRTITFPFRADLLMPGSYNTFRTCVEKGLQLHGYMRGSIQETTAAMKRDGALPSTATTSEEVIVDPDFIAMRDESGEVEDWNREKPPSQPLDISEAGPLSPWFGDFRTITYDKSPARNVQVAWTSRQGPNPRYFNIYDTVQGAIYSGTSELFPQGQELYAWNDFIISDYRELSGQQGMRISNVVRYSITDVETMAVIKFILGDKKLASRPTRGDKYSLFDPPTEVSKYLALIATPVGEQVAKLLYTHNEALTEQYIKQITLFAHRPKGKLDAETVLMRFEIGRLPTANPLSNVVFSIASQPVAGAQAGSGNAEAPTGSGGAGAGPSRPSGSGGGSSATGRSKRPTGA